MKILITGSGGREHALAWKIKQSKQVTEIHCLPGNAGIEEIATCAPIGMMEFDKIIAYAKEHNIDLVNVASDDPLVGGLVDQLTENGIAAFGPNKAAAQLEGSKKFTKEICDQYNIPTAAYKVFTDFEEAKTYLENTSYPTVIKADGLAAGKGAIIVENEVEAVKTLNEMMSNAKFGSAGNTVVIEDFLTGEEASFFFLCDGETALPLGTAQDHKRAYDGDKGPNTGGMGAYSPAPILSDALQQEAIEKIIKPTLQAMKDMGHPFKGILYAGLMLTEKGPFLIEYNVRFGDPEAQVILPRLKNDFVDLMLKTNAGALSNTALEWDDRAALTVIYASKGYPDSYEKGSEVVIPESPDDKTLIFQASTKKQDGKLVNGGGRTLAITAFGDTIKAAQENAYTATDKINWDGGFYRRDIGWRAVKG